jgi:hypothetical protein
MAKVSKSPLSEYLQRPTGRILGGMDGKVRERKQFHSTSNKLMSSVDLRITTATDVSVKTRMWISLAV